MADKNNEELKIKGKVLVNIESRPEEKKIKFTKWINAQRNVPDSFLSIIEHLIDRFGYVDITDHEIAKKLYTEALYFENKPINVESKIDTRSAEIEKSNNVVVEKKPKNTIKADLNSF